MRLTQTLLCVATVLALAACTKPPQQTATPPALPELSSTAAEPVQPVAASAKAVLKPTQNSNVMGDVEFSSVEGGVHVKGVLTGLSPGEHGFHIHEKGDCSAPDASSAGGHFNPDGTNHGKVDAMPHHAGDSNNIVADVDGKATIDQMLSSNTNIGKGDQHDIVGRGVIVHEKADDYTSQPTGDAGGRLACGVIEAM